ncbi:unnamed protein product [Ceutorhynchus assimilis]|uniref:Uncharacterized protein n=1 Tax=Ceutorhynchus assimilis TaxID=467358 RepID=A0A9N9MYS4_9CUCU|nr:unnamed protein product [Ceutorhynchus assimilis]
MGVIGLIFGLFLISLSRINAKDACTNQLYLNSLDGNKIRTKPSSFKDCNQISFEGSDKLNSHLGSIRLAAYIQDNKKDYTLNISFLDIKWTRAHLKLYQDSKPETSICKMYSITNQARLPMSQMDDSCFNLNTYNTSVDYVLEFKAELKTDILYKKLIFRFPSVESYENSVALPKRSLFLTVDAPSNHGIILKIQALPFYYNVTYYKVEVFKDKDDKDILLDVRMLKPKSEGMTFDYITYNEEGHYFFKVSAVNDVCPEDVCLKSVSPQVYIKRKYPPLVIGIVGASFIIPFALFILHMWTRRSQLEVETQEQKDTIFLVYNQTPEKHYQIIKSLEKTLKSLTKVQLVTNINEASHVLYICGMHIFEPDATTHKFLVIEANKAVSKMEIFIISFPYSTKEIPPFLKNCLRFNLMEDFSKFIHLFNCDADFENNESYIELDGQVKAAQIQNEPRKIILNMPIIIVTEQSDSDGEPKEADVLL